MLTFFPGKFTFAPEWDIQDGEIVVSNASSKAIRKAQATFVGVAETMDVTCEDDIQVLVDEVRYGKER